MSKIINLFAAKGFNVQEIVALSDAHTIGFSHGGSKDQMVLSLVSITQSMDMNMQLDTIWQMGFVRIGQPLLKQSQGH
uniref:Plant heme peroxidase family profile domain-containing protein n=1 Tax=Salix viminalis TaxID=40686 RepID=A0A6N2N7L0_SALVM